MNLLLVQNEVRRKFEGSAYNCPIKCIADGVLSFRRAKIVDLTFHWIIFRSDDIKVIARVPIAVKI